MRLSEEIFLKEQVQKELERVQSQGSDLTKKVNDLQRRNESLEKQICALKKQTPQVRYIFDTIAFSYLFPPAIEKIKAINNPPFAGFPYR